MLLRSIELSELTSNTEEDDDAELEEEGEDNDESTLFRSTSHAETFLWSL